MEIQVDYIAQSEEAYFNRSTADDRLWRQLYNEFCDCVPDSTIRYSNISMSMPWVNFIRLKGVIRVFTIAHRSELRFVFTDLAKQMIKSADANSYSAAISATQRTKDDILEKLAAIGFERKLTDNQINNLIKISQLPAAATFSVPGAGKTTEALAYFFLNASDEDRLLVIAPKNAFGAWDEQIADCVPRFRDSFVRLRGGEEAISRLIAQKPRFSIINYEMVPYVENSLIQMLSSGRYFVFLDESHRIKGGKSRAESINRMSHLPTHKLIMSGTPMPQSPKDLVPQFNFLYPTKDVNENDVVDLIQPLYVRTTKSQLGIPAVQYRVITVKMTELQRKIYGTLKSETKRQLNPMLTDSSRYELRRIGKCVMKVMEFVSNPSLLAFDMNYAFDRSIGDLLLQTDGPKIECVCRRARELARQDKKVIIWSSFVKNVELLAMRLSDLGAVCIYGKVDAGSENDEDTREGRIKRFHDDPNCKVIIANPAACAEGISLHKVCHNAIYLDRSFNAAQYLQSVDRIHRLGLSKDDETIVEFVECEDSIDQVISLRLSNKINTMADALDDPSLRINSDDFEFSDEELDDNERISEGDAKAIIDYFFGGETND